MNKLWVDDERPAPDETWDVAKTAEAAIEAIRTTDYDVVSLDYVLIGWESGFDVALAMDKYDRWPTTQLRIHTGSYQGAYQIEEFVTGANPALEVVRATVG